MDETRLSGLHDILEDSYNIQRELEDLSNAFETLTSDIELVLEELSEDLERIHNHLQKTGDAFTHYNLKYQHEYTTGSPKRLSRN